MSFESKAAGVKDAAMGGGMILLALGVGYAGYWLYKNRTIVTEKLNPVSDKNVAYQTASDVGRNVANIFTDKPVSEDATVGTLAYDAVDWFQGLFGYGDAAAERKRQQEVEARKQQASDVPRSPLTFPAPQNVTYYDP